MLIIADDTLCTVDVTAIGLHRQLWLVEANTAVHIIYTSFTRCCLCLLIVITIIDVAF